MKSRKRFSLSLSEKNGLHGYVFIIPFLVGLLFIFLPSVVQSFYYSFCNVQIGFGTITTAFVGLQNYADAFLTDVEYREILLETVRGTFVDTIIIMFFSFFIANILNQKFFGRGLSRTLFFLPVILSTGIITAVDASSASQMMNTGGTAVGSAFSGGALSSFFDLEQLLLSMDIPTGITSVITYAIDNTYTVVNRSGVQILIFLAALQGISPAIFEASKIEGATGWEEFWKITFPMITPMILVNTVYTVVDTFTNPAYGMLDYVEEQAFSYNKMGYSSAVSWVYFLIIFIILIVLFVTTSKKITYLNN